MPLQGRDSGSDALAADKSDTRPSIKQHVGLGHSRRTMRRSEGRVGPRAEAAAFGGHAPLAAGGEVEPFL
jgi:hypothetical protein